MRLLALCALLLFGFSVTAQETGGIAFEEKGFEELLATAKKQDKLIFLDAYTSWCGPCKMMSSKVFPQEEVGKVFNEKFVNAKIDMEKGEGPDIAKRYNVVAYPTYLFINGDGEVVHKALGYIPAEKLIALASVAEGDESLLALSNRYEGGDRDADFMAAYISVLGDAYEQEKAAEVVDAYLQSIEKSEWKSEANMNMIMANPGKLGGDRFKFIVENADAYIKQGSSTQYVGTLQNLIISDYMEANKMRALPEVSAMKAQYEKHAGKMADQLTANYEMEYARRMSPDDFPKMAVAYYNKYPSDDAMTLNSVAWHFFENVDDMNLLKSALSWAMESVRLDKQYMNMDTLAWLYKKLGMNDKAKETALEAIELAKKDGSDYSGTSPILE